MIDFRYRLVENPVPEVKASTVRPRPRYTCQVRPRRLRVAGKLFVVQGASRMSHQTTGTNKAIWGIPTHWQRVGPSQEANSDWY
ncbi:uncharacterized protein B0H64DRAFT_115446 [Chaetomium fimeti]|uniref:Uncharacterized protein n=1 Tax=Chaetomium fimeti TaxID=1854472 RepID=A0AAE0HIA5_9PEZI|nr:hypothetical protein B0H64DRAFT_115446 [Chaetomium fimeti]